MADFLSIFARIAQPYDLAKKSSINTNRKSTSHFVISTKMQSVQNLKKAVITPKRYEIGCHVYY